MQRTLFILGLFAAYSELPIPVELKLLLYIILVEVANSNKSYFDGISLSCRNNAIIFQFTEKHMIHFYLLLKFALLAFQNLLERRVRHAKNKKTRHKTSHVAQSCYSVIGNKPFLWSKPKFDPA